MNWQSLLLEKQLVRLVIKSKFGIQIDIIIVYLDKWFHQTSIEYSLLNYSIDEMRCSEWGLECF